ncbi:Hypothetical protein PHPALM_14449 [Phytophthora palmivora]|uniref:Reverse transcriptase n=1 Tax=Phytophthora palmivora TaxID=4796 RepID=A0A2P4XUP6_9STRA|nr:Hypothetical protein PHPALM_14449 [Phytophthora palmivora]
MEDVERKLMALEIVREEERVTARNIQEFQAGQIRPKEIKTETHASAAAAGASKTQGRTKEPQSAEKTLTRGSEDVKSSLALPSTSKAGSTMLTFRPYTNSATLGMFDEKASIGDRKNWWEKFINMSAQGGWTDQVNLRELKKKMTSPVRNWRGQLPKHVLQDWKKMSTEFRQKSSESALEFFCRLNEAGVKADVRFRKSKKERGEHIKRFIKNLRDSQLKVVLRNQRFRYLEDLEFVLKQNEDLGLDGGYDSYSSQKRDFRADNTTPTRFKSRSRALVSVSEDEGGWESEGHVRFDDDVEEVSAQPEVKIAEWGVLLKLKFQMFPDPIKVSGLGGAQTYITATAMVKITLGMRVVYVMKVWLTNIGEDLEVLLGMDFMYAAGVRLCVREGFVQLPDEEAIMMCGGPDRDHTGLDLPVRPERDAYLQPGEHAIVKIRYGQSNPQREVVWAGRGVRWVTQVIYATKSWAVAVKVVNISQSMLWIGTDLSVARIVECGHFPRAGRYVRPGSPRYKEWQQLIYENTKSTERRRLERRIAAYEESLQPPCVESPEYRWLSKILLRPSPEGTTVRMAQLRMPTSKQPEYEVGQSRPKVNGSTQTTESRNESTQTESDSESSSSDPISLPVSGEGEDILTGRGLRYWNISVSLPKSEFGKLSIPYLLYEISAEGIRAIPRIAKSVQDLPFPSTLKGVQSFLGSLNYYHKFIEDFPVKAAVLYELTDEQIKTGRDLTRAKEAFEILKRKIVSTPLFTGRVLNESEIRYHATEKEVVAVMRVLDVFEALTRDCPIKVYTRYSVLSWLFKSKSADGRCVRWGLILSHWDLEVCKVQRDEDGLAAVLGAGITPREHLDEIAESLIPAKGRVKPLPVISVEMLEEDFKGYVMSFDGAAKTWYSPRKLQVSLLEDVTVNNAEYHKGLILESERGISEIVIVGDSRIVIQQAQGLINCNQPNLQQRVAEYAVLKEKFKSIQLVHVKRDYNQAADYLTSKTLALGEAWTVSDPAELMHLEQVSMIPERIMKPVEVPRKKTTEALVEEPPAEVMKDTHLGAVNIDRSLINRNLWGPSSIKWNDGDVSKLSKTETVV